MACVRMYYKQQTIFGSDANILKILIEASTTYGYKVYCYVFKYVNLGLEFKLRISL